jgi:hypothetical protein
MSRSYTSSLGARMAVTGQLYFMKITAFWDIAPYSLVGLDRCFINRMMMEAVRTSETSVFSNETTRRCIPKGSNFHILRREKQNLTASLYKGDQHLNLGQLGS